MDYREFLDSKSQLEGMAGFKPVWMPDFLMDFQGFIDDYAIRKGRAAIYADCGLGKTPMQLVWSQNVVEYTNKRVLIAAPLGVVGQTCAEGEKFGIKCQRSQDGKIGGPGIYVTNYERLHYFNCNDFVAMVCDESGGIKDMKSKRSAAVIEFMRRLPYRLLCTATPAPNDFVELGTSAEALGEMGYQDMISKFFKQITTKDYLGWGRTKYKLREYAKTNFWRWICSWSRSCRKPSDLGFDDVRFILPELVTEEHHVKPNEVSPGWLFDVPAETLHEQRQEARRTLNERCEMAAELANATDGPSICWAHLNDEGDLMEKLVKDCVQVSGSDSDDAKEEKLLAFANGSIKNLVTKLEIAGYGLNFQHCAHQTYFPAHSFERWYQGVRRSWRFGQTKPVKIDVVTTEGGAGVLANLQRKAAQCEWMFTELVRLMNDSLKVDRIRYGTEKENTPSWLTSPN